MDINKRIEEELYLANSLPFRTRIELADFWAGRAAHRLFPEMNLDEPESFPTFKYFERVAENTAARKIIEGSPEEPVIRACRLARNYFSLRTDLKDVARLCLEILRENEPEFEKELAMMSEEVLTLLKEASARKPK